MKVLIRDGTVIDPANGIDGRKDVLLLEGKIAAVADPGSIDADGAEIVDASGRWVLPGLIDMHVHLREPGYEYRETIETGTRSAVAGGFTAVACMANTSPVNDSAAVTTAILDRARDVGLARVFPIGAVSKGLKGEELAEIGEMREAGIVAVSDDGMPIMSGNLMRRALEYAGMFNLAVIAHEEDFSIAEGGVMNEGTTSLRLGLRGMPAAAEDVMIARDIALLERTRGRLHIAHLSTAGAVGLVREAKARGLRVTAEATPHHFTLTEEAVEGYNTNAKMNPPLRTRADVEAVQQGLADGTIDVIATDHAPHHADEKDVEFDRANNGIVGLETAFALSLALCDVANISRKRLVESLTHKPAEILGIPHGTLSIGAAADVALIDPEAEWDVDLGRLHSLSKNSPFGGHHLRGRAERTFVAGRQVWPLTAQA